MNKVLLSVFALSTCLFFSQQSVSSEKAPIELLETGTYAAEIIKNQTDEKWFVLTQKLGTHINGEYIPTKYRLKEVTIIIQDNNDNDWKQKDVKYEGMPEVPTLAAERPIFLVKGINGMKNREVHTAYFNVNKSCKPGTEHELIFNDLRYKLSCTENKNISEQYQFDVTLGDQVQTLYKGPSVEGYPPNVLLWAGDIDSDGKLDFYCNLATHSVYQDKALFLSSHAKNTLVEIAARLNTSGM